MFGGLFLVLPGVSSVLALIESESVKGAWDSGWEIQS